MFYNTCELECENCNLNICGDFEIILRLVLQDKRTLTKEQREKCIDEITRVEGYDYSIKHLETYTDKELATLTFDAWLDYARDKGFDV